MSLLFPGDWCIECLVDLARQILELRGGGSGVALVKNGCVVLGERIQVEAEFLVDIERTLWHELGEFLREVFVEGSRMNNQVFVKEDVADGVLSEHTLDSASHYLIRVLVDQVLHQNLLETTRIASVMSVKFLIHFITGYFDL